MTNLSRLTLAAALLGGMALPAFAQPVGASVGSPAVSAKLHRHTHHVAAADAAMPKETASKDAMPKETASKDATKTAPAVVGKDAPATTSTAMPKEMKDVPAGKTAATTPAPSATVPSTTVPGASASTTVKPALPGQTSQAPSASPKVN